MDFREAEAAALKWMKKMHFVGAKLTQAGADGGVDVTSKVAVAQVKAEAKSTGRPAVQRIHGVASSQGRKALFFSTSGYTSQASGWADEAGVALFVLDEYRRVRPFNVHAQRIIDGRVASTKGSVASGGVTFGAQPGVAGGMGMNLKFDIIECGSCGHDSPQAAGCQFCGATEPEEDSAVTARRRAVEAARARTGLATAGVTSDTASEIFGAFGESDPIARQLELLDAIDSGDPDWSSQYAANLQGFDAIKAQSLRSSNRSDPVWAFMWPQVDRILQVATDAMDAFERSATASTPELAASYFAKGQQAIDRLMELFNILENDSAQHTRQLQAQTKSSGFGCALPIVAMFACVLAVLMAVSI